MSQLDPERVVADLLAAAQEVTGATYAAVGELDRIEYLTHDCGNDRREQSLCQQRAGEDGFDSGSTKPQAVRHD